MPWLWLSVAFFVVSPQVSPVAPPDDPDFTLEAEERLTILASNGRPVPATLRRVGPSGARVSCADRGTQRFEARTTVPFRAAGSSGAPVIKTSTGAVVGVLLTADHPAAATDLGFETLCQGSKATTPIGADRTAFIGTWLSEVGLVSLTTLEANGRFETTVFNGLDVTASVTGRWLVRDGALVWTYETPGLPAGEDVNPIVELSAGSFKVRETRGSVTSFFRAGVVDPRSPTLLPVAVGTGWILEDEDGQMAMRIGPRERIADRDCYRVDWIEGSLTYQSEYWAVGENGIEVVGRIVLGESTPFAVPALMLPREAAPGDSWTSVMKTDRFEESFTFTVGQPERVTTGAGVVEALPVTAVGHALTVRRWYAPGIGLVQEESRVTGGDQINRKTLKARLR